MERSKVEDAVRAIEDKGQRATMRAIREALGGGSLQDINFHMKAIREDAAERKTQRSIHEDAFSAPVTGPEGGDQLNIPASKNEKLLLQIVHSNNADRLIEAIERAGLLEDLANGDTIPEAESVRLSTLEVRFVVALAKYGSELKKRLAAEAETKRLDTAKRNLEEQVRTLKRKLEARSEPAAIPSALAIPASMRRHFSERADGPIPPAAVNTLGNLIEDLARERGKTSLSELKTHVPELRKTSPARLQQMLFELRSQGRLEPLPDELCLSKR